MKLLFEGLYHLLARNVLVLVLAVVPLLLSSMAGFGAEAFAEEETKQESKYAKAKTKRVKALPPGIAKKLQKITEYLEAEPPQFSSAKAELATTKVRAVNWDGYPQAQFWNLYAYYYYSVENIPAAIKAYEKVLTFKSDLPETFTANTMYQVAQLNYTEENYRRAVILLLEWIKRVETVSAKQKVFIGQVYYQLGEFDNSLRWVQEAIADVQTKGGIPQEGWWGIEKVIYYEKKNFKQIARILEQLVKYYPKTKYWVQLGGVYSEQGYDDKALAAFDVLYIQEKLTRETRLKGLAYMYLGQDVPYRAAQILKWGFDNNKIKRTAENLKLWGECYYSAAETQKAIAVMEEAAGLSDNGELKARLASLYLNADKNKQAIEAARAAVAKGGLKRPGNTYLTLGMALANLKKFDSAITAFKNATRYERSKNTAVNWMKYVQSEKKRNDAIAEGMKHT